ncbi:MAG: chemotaxis protein CheD [Oscillospiraceae bacterium]|nr:chemotaxis protein CheD [Oscillospiraceae bacterium]
MNNTVTVGIADLNIAKGEDCLVTYALGSCVGICLYDPIMRIAGLAHIMLPDSTQLVNVTNQPYKFADTAIIELVKIMQQNGAHAVNLKAKIAGGAQMFAAMSNSSLANIGERNVKAVKAGLMRMHIPLLAEDTGKNYGRTLYFDAPTGTMRIKSAAKGEWEF